MSRSKKIQLFVVLLIIVLIFSSYYYMNTKKIDEIVLVGNIHNTDEEIYEMLGFHPDSTILEVLMNRLKTIEDTLYVDKLKVQYHGLSKVEVEIVEKSIIGYFLHMGKYLCIDSNGFIIDHTEKPDPDKAQIKGIILDKFSVGKPLEVEERILRDIDTLHQNILEYSIDMDVIDFNYGMGQEIVLSKGKVDFYIGNTERIEEKFQLIKEILDNLEESEGGIVDLTNIDGNIILKRK
ncbi:MAG: FtsQ-type POTRA domain-containing protein [Vallitaleaceae bacterium]|nr:FtsQ-type POTRA domain-containing protein [Vallitaleaceae bacterium]